MAASEKKDKILDGAKVLLRSILVSKQHGVSQSKVEKDYEELAGEGLPWRNLGYKTLFDFLMSIPDVAKLEWREEDGDNRVFGVLAKDCYASLHAKRMSVKGLGRGTRPLNPEEIRQWKKNRTQRGSFSDSQLVKKSKGVKSKPKYSFMNDNKITSNNKVAACAQNGFPRKLNTANQNKAPSKVWSAMDLKEASMTNKVVNDDRGSKRITGKSDALTQGSSSTEEGGNNCYDNMVSNILGLYAVCVRVEFTNRYPQLSVSEVEKLVRTHLVLPGCNVVEINALRNNIIFMRFKTKDEAVATIKNKDGFQFNGVRFHIKPAKENNDNQPAKQHDSPQTNGSTFLQSVNQVGILPTPMLQGEQILSATSEKKGLLPTPKLGFVASHAAPSHALGMQQLLVDLGKFNLGNPVTELADMDQKSKASLPIRNPQEMKLKRNSTDSGVFNIDFSWFGAMCFSGSRQKPKIAKDFHDCIQFIVTHAVDACRFWIQLLEQEETVVNLMATLQSEAAKLNRDGIRKVFPSKSHFGIAKYSEDGLWYRSWVLDCSKEKDEIHVFYCDYGNDEVVNGARFRPAPDRLWSLPPQATPVKLHGFDLASDTNVTMKQEGRKLFLKTCLGKILEANVVKGSNLPGSLVIELSNVVVPNVEENYLEDFMVNSGHLKILGDKGMSNGFYEESKILLEQNKEDSELTCQFDDNVAREDDATEDRHHRVWQKQKEGRDGDQLKEVKTGHVGSQGKDVSLEQKAGVPLKNGPLRRDMQADNNDKAAKSMLNGEGDQTLGPLSNGSSRVNSQTEEDWDGGEIEMSSEKNENTLTIKCDLTDFEIENLKSCHSLFRLIPEKTIKIEILSVESPNLFYIRRPNSAELRMNVKSLLENFQPEERGQPIIGSKLCLSIPKEKKRVRVLDLACNFAYSKKVLVIDMDTGQKIWASADDLFVLNPALERLPEIATCVALAGIQTKNLVTNITSDLKDLERKASIANIIGEDESGKLYLEVFKNDKATSVNLQAIRNKQAKISRQGPFDIPKEPKTQNGNVRSRGAKVLSPGRQPKLNSTFNKSPRSDNENSSRSKCEPEMRNGFATLTHSDSFSQRPASRSSQVSFSSESSFSDDSSSSHRPCIGKAKFKGNLHNGTGLSMNHHNQPGEHNANEHANSPNNSSSYFHVVRMRTPGNDFEATSDTHVSAPKPTQLFRPHTPPLPGSDMNAKQTPDDAGRRERLISSIKSLAEGHTTGDIVHFNKDGTLDRTAIEKEIKRWESEKERLKQYGDTLTEVMSMTDEQMGMQVSKNRKPRLAMYVKIMSSKKELEEVTKELNNLERKRAMIAENV